jgi:mRNA interferase MazF
VAPTSAGAFPASYRPEIEIAGRRTRVLIEQLRAIDPSRLGRRVGTVAHGEMRSIDEALKLVLGLF